MKSTDNEGIRKKSLEEESTPVIRFIAVTNIAI